VIRRRTSGQHRSAGSRTFPSEWGSISLARQFVGNSLRKAPAVPEVVVADVELAVSELATNGVRHGSGDPVTIELFRDYHVVTMCVTSTLAVDADDNTAAWERILPTGPSGRGIGIVRAVSTDLAFRIAGRSVFASCNFQLPM
jgi:anti-sigma regulatory factor (Ser/Thr protein kinase)